MVKLDNKQKHFLNPVISMMELFRDFRPLTVSAEKFYHRCLQGSKDASVKGIRTVSHEVILVPILKFKRLNISVWKLGQVRQNIQKWIKSIPGNFITNISLLIYIR